MDTPKKNDASTTEPGWKPEEVSGGTPQSDHAGAAGDAKPKGSPKDDRHATETAGAVDGPPEGR